MDRTDILREAKNCICGDRDEQYGVPENSFAAIGKLWTGYCGKYFTAQDVAIMLALMKIGRIKTGGGTIDSFIDIAGYAACGGEIFSAEKNSQELSL